jgi:lipid-A-disaccharide synthase
MDRLVVKELIQNDLTAGNLTRELAGLLQNQEHQQKLQQDYNELKNLLSAGGNASANAANSITNFLINRN